MRNGNKSIESSGMPRMGVMEELNALCGNLAGDDEIQLPYRRKRSMSDSASAAAPDHHGDSPGVDVELLVTARCAAGRTE